MGRFRSAAHRPEPQPRQTVVACWISSGLQSGQWTVTIQPPGHEPILLFVDPRHVMVTEPVHDHWDTAGQLKVHLLHIGETSATVLLPAPAVGIGTKLTLPKHLLASVPLTPPRKGLRP